MALKVKAILFGAFVVAVSTPAALPPVPPEVLAQLKGMSPAEQSALARQYGFDLQEVLTSSGGGSTSQRSEDSLGARGEPLRQVQPGAAEQPIQGPMGEELDPSEDKLERYGHRLFDAEISTFAPVDNIPVPEGYRLGVGDMLSLTFFGKEQGDFSLLIDRNGSVTIPKLGSIILSGLTFPDAKTLIERRVSEQLIGSEAVLSMGSMRSINIFMAGEVNNPGNYSVSALTTLSQAIFVSGGISEAGSYRDVQLRRDGKTVRTFDIYDLLLFGDNSGDVRLRSGDVVFVPIAGPQMSVEGEVTRPAIYEFKDGDSLETVISMAGGIRPRAYSRQALLNRYEEGDSLPKISNLNLMSKETMEMEVRDGDQLSIRAASTRLSNPIAISGATELNGLIGWSEGLSIADVFQDLEADVEPSADLTLSLIVRRENTLNDIKVLSFSISNALLNEASVDNLALKPFDQIVILPLPTTNRRDFDRFRKQEEEPASESEISESDSESESELLNGLSRQQLIAPIVRKLKQQARSGDRVQVVTVTGAVQLPGEYPLIGNGNIESVVAIAGGYSDDAYLKNAEVRRISLGANQQANVVFFNLDLSAKEASAFRLQGRDALRINKIPSWSTEDTVQLEGEFLFPGTYIISEGESLRNLIDRAGGFTDDAFLGGAQFFSATAREAQAKQLRKITKSLTRRVESRKSAGEYEGDDGEIETQDQIDEDLLGRVVVDLQAILEGDQSADVLVESGDTLYVPKFSNTIAVVGEVYEPGTFQFDADKQFDQYINTAGGFTTLALRKNIYLLKANGNVRFKSRGWLRKLTKFDANDDNGVEPGDVIVVPTNLDYDPPLERVKAVTNVVFQSLTSVAAFLSLSKN